ncbi:cell division cycle protein 16 homolog [Microplitis demolitor]|uniref:cell division cycle protein 16 homolog n=1 Tax=Microplitis demolitor TaxID=69319 RepID=UPI0004CD9C45|nr:cell division cycle protein 16 homolog [Microplitis demolitor]
MSRLESDIDCNGMQNLNDTKNINLDNFRKLVKSYIDSHLYSAALFWADKVVSLSNEEPRDICTLAQCMYLMKQYHRAAHLIRSRGLEKTDSMCHYLTIRSLLEAKEFTEALQIINETELCTSMSQTGVSFMEHTNFMQDAPKNVQSSIFYVKGRVHEATDNRSVAADCYKQALHYDVYSYQAFEALVQNQMLSAAEEKELLDSLPFNEQCSEADRDLLKLLYESKLKKYQAPMEDLSITCGTKGVLVTDRLQDNLDMQVAKAERLYYNCDYQQCFSLTETILKKDPYHNCCLPVHIACLVELKKTNALFYLAHKLVDLYPDMALAWFAVGCYYFAIGKSDHARRYLAKATALDRLFGPAWLAYGHSFAVENEHDQAMAAYFKASQLMKGCHLPLLYIGLECGLTNNLKLADKFFQQAQSIAPNDPFVIHETGVISFSNLDYKTAERQFKEALSKIQIGGKNIVLPSKWEPLLNNLGHTCRKLKKYEEALDYHQQALVLNPLNPSTYSAIGFIHALIGNTQEAVDAFHRALGLRRDDTFTTTMLGYVLEQLIDESPPFPDAPTEMPKYKFPEVPLTTEPTETTENSAAGTAGAPEQEMDKLRVNLFSSWGDDNTGKSEENAPRQTERPNDVNYSSGEMDSEVEMLDSSTAHIEY